jgi:hypothetical protein
MDAEELARWQEMNGRAAANRAARPCADCPLGYAVEMRALGRCNGTPGGVEEDTEMGTFDYTGPERPQPEPKEAPRALTMTRRVELEVAAPPCGSCAHEPVCALRAAFEGMATVETSAPPLPDGLRLTLTASVECAHYLRDRAKPAPVRATTPQERGQANGAGQFREKRRLSPEAVARMAAGNRARAEARRAAREGAAAG